MRGYFRPNGHTSTKKFAVNFAGLAFHSSCLKKKAGRPQFRVSTIKIIVLKSIEFADLENILTAQDCDISLKISINQHQCSTNPSQTSRG